MSQALSAALISVSGFSLTDEEKRVISQHQPLGVTLFLRNISTRKQVAELCKQIREAAQREDIIIAIDQEGGRVRRLAEPEFRPYASQYVLGRLEQEMGAPKADIATRDHALLISHDLIDCGINLNYAPVLDLAFEETAAVLKSRCFGNDEKQAARLGKIMVETYIKNGICPCIKHMPGHGRITVDPHLGLPVLTQSLKELEKDFYPFRALSASPAGMTAHVVIPEIDDKNPITQSAFGIKELIREVIGFDGLLISDSINMRALKGNLREITSKCISAGCDCVCYCDGIAQEAAEVCQTAGFMSDKSIIRFEKIKNLFHNKPNMVNLEAIAAEYEALVGQIEKYQDDYDATEVLNKMKQHKGE